MSLYPLDMSEGQLAIVISAVATIISGLAIIRAESIRRAVRRARPGDRLRQPLTVIRDAFEEVAATPSLWSKHKVSIGAAKKQIEAELAGTKDDSLGSKLRELNGFIQSAFDAGVARGHDAYGQEVGQDLDTVKQESLAGERVSKEALTRIAELDAEI
jgi:hypothetical protein